MKSILKPILIIAIAVFVLLGALAFREKNMAVDRVNELRGPASTLAKWDHSNAPYVVQAREQLRIPEGQTWDQCFADARREERINLILMVVFFGLALGSGLLLIKVDPNCG